MKLTSKIITLVVVSMGFAQVVCQKEQKIVAYKGSDIDSSISSSLSAIEIRQGNELISSAKFKRNTSGAQYGHPTKKYLFFHKDNLNPITVRFWKTAADKEAGQPAIKTELLNVPIADIPEGARIKIGGATPFTIVFDLSKAKTTRVNVVKTDPNSYGKKWTIYSLGQYIEPSSVATPPKDIIYDKVTIAKDTTTRRLKIPNNKKFWIFIPRVQGTTVTNNIITPFEIQPNLSTTTVINIDGKGVATITP